MIEAISFKLDEETRAKLDELAFIEGQSKDWVVREAIRHYALEVADLEIAMERLQAPDTEWMDHKDVKRACG